MDPTGFIIVAVLCVTLGTVVAIRRRERFAEALRLSARQGKPLVVRMPFAVLGAYFLSSMLSPDAIVKLVGGESGMTGILAASVLGAALPGGPFISFPLALIVWHQGAGVPQLIAFLTAWSVLAVHRVLVYEIPILGGRFVAVRIASSFMMPPLAGVAAMLFTG